MYECEKCGANCDAGELVGGVCVDCLQHEHYTMTRAYRLATLLNSPYHQLTLDFGGEAKCLNT